ncbi:MAG: hypothetical protein COA42_00665 [Alteromonadaceae bacterium]|nr:MAG: hypothetical protein COA42_00665 [Alteromonadaceae bacterium]
MSVSPRWHAFASLIRLPNVFTVLSNVVAAHIVATQADIQPVTLLMTLLASAAFYHGGMVVNDCLDFDEDRQMRPKRPLPAGHFSLRQAWTIAVFMMLLGLILSVQLGGVTGIVALLLAAFIFGYNLSNREGYWGCVWMGCCRLLNWALALSAVGGLAAYWPYALVVAVYVSALTIISRDEVKATRPQLVAWCASVMLVGALGFVFFLHQWGSLNLIAMGLFVLGLMAIGWRLWQLSHNYQTSEIQRTIKFFVLGLIPLDAALVWVSGYPVFAVAVVLLLIPSRVLARYFYVT